jgi:hypothetical protein
MNSFTHFVKLAGINSFLSSPSTVARLKELRGMAKGKSGLDVPSEYLTKFKSLHQDAMRDHFAPQLASGGTLPAHSMTLGDLGVHYDAARSPVLNHTHITNTQDKSIRGAGVSSVRIADLLGRRSGMGASQLTARWPGWAHKKPGYTFRSAAIPTEVQNSVARNSMVDTRYSSHRKGMPDAHADPNIGGGYKPLDPTAVDAAPLRKSISSITTKPTSDSAWKPIGKAHGVNVPVRD